MSNVTKMKSLQFFYICNLFSKPKQPKTGMEEEADLAVRLHDGLAMVQSAIDYLLGLLSVELVHTLISYAAMAAIFVLVVFLLGVPGRAAQAAKDAQMARIDAFNSSFIAKSPSIAAARAAILERGGEMAAEVAKRSAAIMREVAAGEKSDEAQPQPEKKKAGFKYLSQDKSDEAMIQPSGTFQLNRKKFGHRMSCLSLMTIEKGNLDAEDGERLEGLSADAEGEVTDGFDNNALGAHDEEAPMMDEGARAPRSAAIDDAMADAVEAATAEVAAASDAVAALAARDRAAMGTLEPEASLAPAPSRARPARTKHALPVDQMSNRSSASSSRAGGGGMSGREAAAQIRLFESELEREIHSFNERQAAQQAALGRFASAMGNLKSVLSAGMDSFRSAVESQRSHRSNGDDQPPRAYRMSIAPSAAAASRGQSGAAGGGAAARGYTRLESVEETGEDDMEAAAEPEPPSADAPPAWLTAPAGVEHAETVRRVSIDDVSGPPGPGAREGGGAAHAQTGCERAAVRAGPAKPMLATPSPPPRGRETPQISSRGGLASSAAQRRRERSAQRSQRSQRGGPVSERGPLEV